MAEKTTQLANKQDIVQLTCPADVVPFATEIAKLVTDNKMFTVIQGKKYVNVEGWQTAGAFTGIFPIVESSENISSDNEIKYRAKVSLWQGVGDTKECVGQAFATCSNKERGKNNFAEYAVESMAQTRALGKAYRMKLGWLLKIAGYEATPSEEMDTVVVEAEPVKQQSKPKPKPKAESKYTDEDNKRHNSFIQMYKDTAAVWGEGVIKETVTKHIGNKKFLEADKKAQDKVLEVLEQFISQQEDSKGDK